MAVNSKQKGNRGERALAKVLREYGYECRRAQQYAGGLDSADVVGLTGIHIECKTYKDVTDGLLDEFLEQAIRDSKKSKNIPCVFWKEDHRKWHVTMDVWGIITMINTVNKSEMGNIMLKPSKDYKAATLTLETWMKMYREYEATLRIKELQGV